MSLSRLSCRVHTTKTASTLIRERCSLDGILCTNDLLPSSLSLKVSKFRGRSPSVAQILFHMTDLALLYTRRPLLTGRGVSQITSSPSGARLSSRYCAGTKSMRCCLTGPLVYRRSRSRPTIQSPTSSCQHQASGNQGLALSCCDIREAQLFSFQHKHRAGRATGIPTCLLLVAAQKFSACLLVINNLHHQAPVASAYYALLVLKKDCLCGACMHACRLIRNHVLLACLLSESHGPMARQARALHQLTLTVPPGPGDSRTR